MEQTSNIELQNKLNELAGSLDSQWNYFIDNSLQDTHPANDFYRGMIQTLTLLGGKWERDEKGHHKVYLFGGCGQQVEDRVGNHNYVQEYHEALKKRDDFKFNSKEWNDSQKEILSILRDGIVAHNQEIADELVDTIDTLLDCDTKWDEEEIRQYVKLLEENGYHNSVENLKKLNGIG